MTDRELMQMALDALEHLQTDVEWQYKSPTRAMLRKVEKALRARLAQPEPELFGWVKIDEVRQHFDTAGCGTIYKTGGEGRVPLYAAPQRELVATGVIKTLVGISDDGVEIWKDEPFYTVKDKNYD